MLNFVRADQCLPDEGRLPTPRTWDYMREMPYAGAESKGPWKYFLAHSTCGNGHTAVISSQIHAIAADGKLTPSYVCPSKGCKFHEMVRFVGWEADPAKRVALPSLCPPSPVK